MKKIYSAPALNSKNVVRETLGGQVLSPMEPINNFVFKPESAGVISSL